MLQDSIHEHQVLSEGRVGQDQLPAHLRPLCTLSAEDHGDVWRSLGRLGLRRNLEHRSILDQSKCPVRQSLPVDCQSVSNVPSKIWMLGDVIPERSYLPIE